MSIVPVNLKEQDSFHLTIEEYLLSLIAMAEELVSRFNHPIHDHLYGQQLISMIVSSGCQLGHPWGLHAPHADRQLRQGFVCRVSAAESEERCFAEEERWDEVQRESFPHISVMKRDGVGC